MKLQAALLALAIAVVGCSGLDPTHRALLLERIRNLGHEAALGWDEEHAAAVESETAAIVSDVDANLK